MIYLDETEIAELLQVGGRVYIGGKHCTVTETIEVGKDGDPEIRLTPNGRKQHWTDVWPRRSVERMLRQGRALPSGAEENGRADGAATEPATRTKGGASMARGELKKSHAEATAAATAPLAEGKDEATASAVNRYGEQWARYKTGVRSSAPPNLGLSKETVDEVRQAVEAALA